MWKLIIIIKLILILNKNFTCGFNIKRNNVETLVNSKNILDLWNELKFKLEPLDNSNFKSEGKLPAQKFNETEALHLIPNIIERLRAKMLTSKDKRILSNIYGSVWSLIEDEIRRNNDDPINPILEAIFDGLQSGENQFPITNDIVHNSLDLIKKKKKKDTTKRHNHNHKINGDKIKVHVDETDELSQRVLKTAAVLIRNVMRFKRTETTSTSNSKLSKKSNRIKSRRLIKSLISKNVDENNEDEPATMTLNLNLEDIPISSNVNRQKRQIKITIDNKKKDLPSDKIEELLKLYKQKNGINYNETDDESNEEIYGKAIDESINDDDYEEDEEAAPSIHGSPYTFGNFDSFQDLILKATNLQKYNNKDETKLVRANKKRYFIKD